MIEWFYNSRCTIEGSIVFVKLRVQPRDSLTFVVVQADRLYAKASRKTRLEDSERLSDWPFRVPFAFLPKCTPLLSLPVKGKQIAQEGKHFAHSCDFGD